MERTLKFLKTYTIEQFKALTKVDRLDVKKNPKNGNLFFTFGAETGAVASAGIPKHPMVSYVEGEKTERNPTGLFYLLHEEGNGAPTIASF